MKNLNSGGTKSGKISKRQKLGNNALKEVEITRKINERKILSLYRKQIEEINDCPFIMEKSWNSFLWFKWKNYISKEEMRENRTNWKDEAIYRNNKQANEQVKLINQWINGTK